MGTLIKGLFILLVVLVIVSAGGLVIMAGVAGTHDVKRIPVPKECSLYTLSTMWDYSDAYRRPMEFNSYHNIKQVADNVTIKGDGEIHRSDKEVVYAGHLPGIDYQAAYLLDRSGFPPAVELVTCYRLKSTQGRYLWKVFRRVHRGLAPYMLDRLGERAPG